MTAVFAGLSHDLPSAYQLSELFLRIVSGHVTRTHFQVFLGGTNLLEVVGSQITTRVNGSSNPRKFFMQTARRISDKYSVLPKENIFNLSKDFMSRCPRWTQRHGRGSIVVASALKKDAEGDEIISEFAGSSYHLSFWQISELLRRQLNGESGLLGANGESNICFLSCRGSDVVEEAVEFSFLSSTRKWNIDIKPVKRFKKKKWKAGTRILNS
jgi:hypothetical protein